jgi:hypothetical protein
MVQNGGFEDGGAGWQQVSTGGYDLISDANPRTGRLGAYLGGVNNADDRLSQQVSLPIGVITLHPWWYMSTAETAGSFDQMTMTLLLPDGRWLADLSVVDNLAEIGVWHESVIDLSSYAGQTVILQFTSRTDDANISDFYLDDVSITACVADPQPTATLTATQPPPTATRTPTAPGATATLTRTATQSPTATLTATQAPPTATGTATVPGATATPTRTATQSPTVTPVATTPPGVTPTVTATSTAHPEWAMQRTYLPMIMR